MILKLALLLCLLALASPQDHDDSQQPELDLEQLQRQEASMKRTACLILSRYHSNAHKEVIEEIVSTLQGEDQSKYINKMYAMAVERCLPSISVDEAQMVPLPLCSSSASRATSTPLPCSTCSMGSTTPRRRMTSTACRPTRRTS